MSDIFDNIRSQPENLAQVAEYHRGAGKSVLLAAAQILQQAEQIVFTGMGSSLFAGIPAARALCRHGISAHVLNNADLLHGNYPALRRAVVVLNSRSGESIEAVRLLPLLKAQATTVIGLTNVPDSTVARQCDHLLLMHSAADQMVSIQTYTATVLTLLMLSSAVTGDLGANFDRRLEASLAALSGVMQAWIGDSQTWVEFLENVPVIYLLGRGDSQAAMMQGALMFNEVAKRPSVAMEVGIFRHGPVEVVHDRFRAIVFTPADETRDLNLSAVDDLLKLGAQIRHIGPDLDTFDAALCWQTPSTDFAPLMEIIPVQLVACRLAQRRGIVPGKLLITPLVTRDEVGFGKP